MCSEAVIEVTFVNTWRRLKLELEKNCTKNSCVFIDTSPSVSVASRAITLSQRSLCDLCSFVLDSKNNS